MFGIVIIILSHIVILTNYYNTKYKHNMIEMDLEV